MRYLWPLVIWMCSYTVYAQVHLDQVSLREGLSQSEVDCILQDSQGYMWFGTQDGLNRYDGVRMKQYHQEPFAKETLSGERVSVLFEDSRQWLWVGTEQGICCYDRQRDKFIPVFTIPPSEKHTQLVRSIVEDRWKTLWVSTLSGLWRIIIHKSEPLQVQVVPYSDQLPDTMVYDLTADAQGNIWAGTYEGLNRIAVSGQVPAMQKINVENGSTHSSPLYTKTAVPFFRLQSFGDKLWASSRNRFFCISVSDEAAYELTSQLRIPEEDQIMTFWMDHTQVFWIGTYGSGVYRYAWHPQTHSLQLLEHIRENRHQENGLKSSSVIALYEGKDAHEDLVWLGTKEAGVQTYSRSKNSFHNWSDVLSKERRAMEVSVFAMYTDSYGDLWAGSLQGLAQVNRKTRKAVHRLVDSEHMDANVIFSLYEDAARTLWIGTAQGLYWWDRTHEKFRMVALPSFKRNGRPMVRKILEDKQGNLWVATRSYLALLKKEKTTYQPDTLLSQWVHKQDTLSFRELWDVDVDQTGAFWLGTNSGLLKINMQTGDSERFVYHAEHPEGIMSNTILDIYHDASHQLWLCSPKGLSKMIGQGKTAHFQHFTTRHGLPNAFVYGALSDSQNQLWVSTNAGIACLDTRTMKFRSYDINDGLTNVEFNSGAFHKSKDGELFFGGIGVLVSFRPEQMVENRHLPRINVSAFQLNQQEASMSRFQKAGVLQIRYRDFFAFFLSVTDYTNPSKNQILYKLEGLQDNWTPLEKPHIGVADISSGHYVLKLKAANSQGYWNEKDTIRIPIYIIPPFWQTWWFYVLIGLTVVVAGFLLYRYRVRMKIERVLERETIKSEENERVRKLAAQDMHDEFGNGLTRIAVLTEMVKTKVNGHGTEVAPLLEKISDNAQQLYQGTKDFIWSINPEHDNLYEIAIRLKDFGEDIFDRTAATFEVSGLCEHLKEFPLPMDTSRHLVLIFKEAMSNTLKYAGATRVMLAFWTVNTTLYIEWKDNGKGFDSVGHPPSQGMQNMKNRTLKIGGTLSVSSKKNIGTSVLFFMNIPQNG